MNRLLDKLFLIAKYQTVIALRYRNGAPFRMVASAVEIASAYFLARAVGPQFRPDGFGYFAFLLTGTGLYFFFLAVVNSCVSFVDDAQRSGTIEVLMTTPTPPLQVLMLNVLPLLAWRGLGMILYLSAGMVLFATDPLRINALAAIVVFSLLLLVAAAFGMIGAAVQMIFFRGNSLVWALGVLGGLFMGTAFPVSVLPAPLQWIATALPLRTSLDALRAAILQNATFAELSATILQLFIFGAVFLLLGVVSFEWALRRARKTGTLAFY
jgi:ABC-2 type transport system permease protein